MINRRVRYFISLIQRDDPYEIESARDEVTENDVAPLVEAYWGLTTWEEKAGLIQLIQDYIDPHAHDVMLDFLKAPPDPNGDYFEVTKAIALCHLDGDFAAFTRYYKDRDLLAATAERYLHLQKAQR